MVQLLQNSQKYRVLWCNCHRTHRSVGYSVQLRSQNSQGNLCRTVTTPGIDLYLHTFVPWVRLGSINMIIIKDRIKGRLKRARVRTPYKVQPNISQSSTIRLLQKRKRKKILRIHYRKYQNTNTIVNTPYLPTSPLSKHNLNDEKTNAINFWRR